MFAGEIALVTGGASGIGRATVEAFRAPDAAVVALDRDARSRSRRPPTVLGIECDVTDDAVIERALESASIASAGSTSLVLNAGVFPPSSADRRALARQRGGT